MAYFANAPATDKVVTGAGQVKASESSGTLVKENRQRVALYVSNDSTATVYLAFESKAEKSKGIRIPKETALPYPITHFTGEVTVIATAAEALVAFIEV